MKSCQRPRVTSSVFDPLDSEMAHNSNVSRKRKNPDFHDIAVSALDSIDDAELLTLRAHATMEAFLYHLLAADLGIPEGEVPQLSMVQLVGLALRGKDHTDLRAAVMRFTEIRNQVAHARLPLGYTTEMVSFAKLLETECNRKASMRDAIGPYREGLKALVLSVVLYAKFAIEAPAAE